jgi:hypothetical protein
LDFTKEQIYNIFINDILGKDKIYVEGFAFNTTYNYKDIQNNKYVLLKDSLPVLQIKNTQKLKDALYDYVIEFFNSKRKFTHPEERDDIFFRDKNKLTFALCNLFINAGFEDFEDITSYINRRTDFLKSTLVFENNNWNVAGAFEDVKGANIFFRIAENNFTLETPDRLEIKVQRINETGNIEEIYLPSITFGISKDTAYIYTIQNLDFLKTENPKFQKEINKARYRINKNVPQEDLDVEPFAIISATVLTAFLKSLNINTIYINNFLPIRYLAKQEANVKKAKNDEAKLQELNDIQQHIQENLTYKFLKTFFRVCDQTGSISLFSDVEPGFTIFKNSPVSNIKNPSPILINLYNNTLQTIATSSVYSHNK